MPYPTRSNSTDTRDLEPSPIGWTIIRPAMAGGSYIALRPDRLARAGAGIRQSNLSASASIFSRVAGSIRFGTPRHAEPSVGMQRT
jgi:hypothetical protein